MYTNVMTSRAGHEVGWVGDCVFVSTRTIVAANTLYAILRNQLHLRRLDIGGWFRYVLQGKQLLWLPGCFRAHQPHLEKKDLI